MYMFITIIVIVIIINVMIITITMSPPSVSRAARAPLWRMAWPRCSAVDTHGLWVLQHFSAPGGPVRSGRGGSLLTCQKLIELHSNAHTITILCPHWGYVPELKCPLCTLDSKIRSLRGYHDRIPGFLALVKAGKTRALTFTRKYHCIPRFCTTHEHKMHDVHKISHSPHSLQLIDTLCDAHIKSPW